MPRPARRYSRRIEFWNATTSDDGFGGEDRTDALVKELWAQVETLDRQKSIEFGLNVDRRNIEVQCRRDPDINWDDGTLFIKFSGREFGIQRVVDSDFDGIEMSILATE